MNTSGLSLTISCAPGLKAKQECEMYLMWTLGIEKEMNPVRAQGHDACPCFLI